tara:strand:- start:567 stop:755 length:189 start_codon:yes stop_codon:yes gene_type:complete
MKVKLKDPNMSLPNCWKQCGVSKLEWDKLQSGGEIDVKTIFVGIKHLVKDISSPVKKEKGVK